MGEEAYIYEAIRTPRGKASPRGSLAGHSPVDLLVTTFADLRRRTGLDSALVDDVVIGAARQHSEQGSNIARLAALMTGWDESLPGVTISRACASGLEALNVAAARIKSTDADLIVSGGVESLSRVPMFSENGPLSTDQNVKAKVGGLHMGIAADLVATLEKFEREELDAFGLRTQHLAAAAEVAGRFANSMVPVMSKNDARICDKDEHIRHGMDMAKMAELEPAFAELGANGQDSAALAKYPELKQIRHLHTRGSSPSLADGAGLVLVGNESAAQHLNGAPRARILSSATKAVNPFVMLTAGQEATVAAIERAGLTVDDIGRFEFAEAFSALCLRFQRDLHVEDERFNVNGGTIAIGHAFGSTGPFLVTNLLDELERSGERFGVVAISGGSGVGVATVIERI